MRRLSRSLDTADGTIRGAVVRDGLRRAGVQVRAGAIVNATGPWAESIRRLESDAADRLIVLKRSA